MIAIEKPVSATQKMVTRMEGSSRMKLPQAAKAALASWRAKKFRCRSDSLFKHCYPSTWPTTSSIVVNCAKRTKHVETVYQLIAVCFLEDGLFSKHKSN